MLLKAVGKCASLQRLYLRSNRIGVTGAAALATVLRRTRCLSYVDVSANFLTTTGVRLVTQALLQRAQARLERRTRARAGGGAATPSTAVAPAGSGGAARSSASASAGAGGGSSSSTTRHLAPGRGWGWLFGDASELIVTTNSIVRTNWASGVVDSAVVDTAAATASTVVGGVVTGGAATGGGHQTSGATGSAGAGRPTPTNAMLMMASTSGAGDGTATGSAVRRRHAAAGASSGRSTPVPSAQADQQQQPHDGGGGGGGGPFGYGVRTPQRGTDAADDGHGGGAGAGQATPGNTTSAFSFSNALSQAVSNLQSAAGGGGGGIGSLEGAGGRSSSDLLGGGDGAAATAASDDMSVDIEVRIAGNFVREEMVNAGVHAVGLLLSIAGAFPLLARARAEGDNRLLVGYIVYLAGLISLFATSTLNHSLHMLESHAFQQLNHSAVYVLIAGTYSPFLLVNLRHVTLGVALLVAVWVIAVLGVIVSTACSSGEGGSAIAAAAVPASAAAAAGDGAIAAAAPVPSPSSLFRRRLPLRLRPLLYAGMGWLALIPFYLLYPCLQPEGWYLLGGGGLLFSLGVVLYIRERRTATAISSTRFLFSWWYVLVVIACASHYAAVYHYVQIPDGQCTAQAVSRGLQLVPTPAPTLTVSAVSTGPRRVVHGGLPPLEEGSMDRVDQQHHPEDCSCSDASGDALAETIGAVSVDGVAAAVAAVHGHHLPAQDQSHTSRQTAPLPPSHAHQQPMEAAPGSGNSGASSQKQAATEAAPASASTLRDAASHLMHTLSTASAAAAADGRRAVIESMTTMVQQMTGELEQYNFNDGQWSWPVAAAQAPSAADSLFAPGGRPAGPGEG